VKNIKQQVDEFLKVVDESLDKGFLLTQKGKEKKELSKNKQEFINAISEKIFYIDPREIFDEKAQRQSVLLFNALLGKTSPEQEEALIQKAMDLTVESGREEFLLDPERFLSLPFKSFAIVFKDHINLAGDDMAFQLLGMFVSEKKSGEIQITLVERVKEFVAGKEIIPTMLMTTIPKSSFLDGNDNYWISVKILRAFLVMIHGDDGIYYGEASVGSSKTYKLLDRKIRKEFQKVVLLKPKKAAKKPSEDTVHRGVIWYNSVWIPGHWRRSFKKGTREPDPHFLGKDRDGSRNQSGRTWVVEHVRGDGPLIERIWIAQKKNPAKIEIKNLDDLKAKLTHLQKFMKMNVDLLGTANVLSAYIFFSIIDYALESPRSSEEEAREVKLNDIDQHMEEAISSLNYVAKKLLPKLDKVGEEIKVIEKFRKSQSEFLELRILDLYSDYSFTIETPIPFHYLRRLKGFQKSFIIYDDGKAYYKIGGQIRLLKYLQKILRNPRKYFQEMLKKELTPPDDDFDDDGDDDGWSDDPGAA